MVARDIILAELTGAHLHIAHISTAGAVRLVREAKARGVRVTARGDPAPPGAHRRGGARLRPQLQDGAAAPHRSATSRRAWKRLIDGTIDCVATDHAPARHLREGGRVRGGRQRHRRARDRGADPAGPPGAAGRGRPADPGRAAQHRTRAPAEPARRQPRARGGGGRHHPRSRAGVDGGPGRVPVAEPQHALRRLHRHRRAVDDAGRRRRR